jgi:hypothetical protein
MGLDISHDCWHGSYSSFARFREKLAEVCGYGNINDMVGFSDDRPGKGWPGVDPIEKLLDHSDCDGEIRWQDCEGIAKSFERVLLSLAVADALSGDNNNYYSEKAVRWISGLRCAAEEKENVTFG